MTGLEALEELIGNYKEICDDTNDNDIQYQLCNLTSPYHTIRRDLELLELIRDKKVDIEWIIHKPCENEYEYNCVCDIELTKDEFERIKGWLEGE